MTPFIPCGAANTWNAHESGHPYAFRDNDGKAYLFYQGTTTRAGSSIGIFDCLKNFQIFTSRSLEECLPVYSTNPATLLSLNSGIIKENSPADFVILKDNEISQV